MSSEGITLPWLSLFQTQQDQAMPDSKSVSSYLESLKQRNTCWDRIVLPKPTDHVAGHGHDIIVSLYERAISECPTVETLWASYMKFLSEEFLSTRDELKKGKQNPQDLQQHKTNDDHWASINNLEPDDISAVIKEAIELGFLTSNKEAMLHLRLVAIHVVKRRLLSLISLRSTGKDLTKTNIEEVKDLIEDIRDMYDEAENYLFKSHATWVEGKVTFWKHRATSEAYVLCPIAKNNANDDMTDVNSLSSEKPSNPDSWMDYIRYVSSSHVHSFGGDNIFSQLHPDGFAAVPSVIRKTRGLYNRALSSVRKADKAGLNNDMFERNYDNSLLDLCREFLCFERAFGSEESLSRAQTLVRSKMAQWTAPPPQMITNGNEQSDDTHGKRKAVEEVPSNDAMEEDGDDEMQVNPGPRKQSPNEFEATEEDGGSAQSSHWQVRISCAPGMHRVKPKGEGKSSKRNEMKKGPKLQVDTSEERMDCDNGGDVKSGKRVEPAMSKLQAPYPLAFFRSSRGI
ncbi:hypothetical protein QTG54_004132 [Skeletonema marinoi]|uniref:Uncharacterized protein n=1 Tax=Skeletonema marinoi TaxID=267567 RepID=A0AAD8YGQ3_9STRA|nr:hypothetical protein QTG54_004132 [Skeletonema marinoi]